MTMINVPSQGDLAQLLGLIDLVRLAVDADKSREVVETIRRERQAYDDAIERAQAAERSAAAAAEAARVRVDEARQAEIAAAEVVAHAAAAKAEAGEFVAGVVAQRDDIDRRLQGVAQLERAAAVAVDNAHGLMAEAQARYAQADAALARADAEAKDIVAAAVAVKAAADQRLRRIMDVAAAEAAVDADTKPAAEAAAEGETK